MLGMAQGTLQLKAGPGRDHMLIRAPKQGRSSTQVICMAANCKIYSRYAVAEGKGKQGSNCRHAAEGRQGSRADQGP